MNPANPHSRSRRRVAWIAGTTVMVFAVVAVFSAVRGKAVADVRAAAPAALEFVAADLHTVREEAFARTLPMTGTLSPLTEAVVKARVPGELIDVSVREGDTVRRGQVVARIDPTELRSRVAARAADLEAARAQQVLAGKNRELQSSLLEQKFISRNAFDTTQSTYEVAVARTRAAEAELALARKAAEDSEMAAPFAGVVSQRLAQRGERVSVDAGVLTIVDLSRLQLDAAVPASDIAEVRIGQSVTFRVDGFGERQFAGRVERINPTTTPGTRSIAVYALVENGDGTLRGGMFAQGSLTLERAEHAVAVPSAAVRSDGSRHHVYVLEGGAVVRRAVLTGREDSAGRVNILSGLRAGEVIVRNNLGALRDGAAARVIERQTAR